MLRLPSAMIVVGTLIAYSDLSPAWSGQSILRKESLFEKQFRFSWRSDGRSGFNGIATLREDGTIAGIPSPNETTWLLDEQGRLVFKHQNGTISTIFTKVQRRDGRHYFEGPFQFREGIVHVLQEIGEAAHSQDLNKLIKRYSSQEIICLDVGEDRPFRLKDGSERVIRLVSSKVNRDSVLRKARQAQVDVEIDGKPVRLDCGPYVMPTEINGLRIQADATSGWVPIPKAVQFSVWDAADPIVNSDRFGFPVRNYRLFSHGMQSYGEVVHLGLRDGDPRGQTFCHDYGIDLAGYEGREVITSCTDGKIVRLRPTSANPSSVVVEDKDGLLWEYAHLDSVFPHVQPGGSIRRGQEIGMLGKRGGSGNFSHAHLGTYLSKDHLHNEVRNRRLNLYPWIVTAYQDRHGGGLHAVARPHRAVTTGETFLLDGSNSLCFDANVVSYRWELPNGETANGARAETVFHKPGVYSVVLRITDDKGREDVDLCRVKVFTKTKPEASIPTIFMTHTPTESVVGEPVLLRMWLQGGTGEPIRVDFGDGALIDEYTSYSEIEHRFETPGIHVITAQTTVDGKPITQKQKVIVGTRTGRVR